MVSILGYEITKRRPSVEDRSERGSAGTAVFGGYIYENEINPNLVGATKYRTYADIVVNTSVVAAGIRSFVNLVAKAQWTPVSVDDTPEAKKYAEIVHKAMDEMETDWTRLIRRISNYRFYGFNIHEWVLKMDDDGNIGFKGLYNRPQHTIERWEVDDNGHPTGVWQRVPQTSRDVFLPMRKVVHVVDDTLSDSPEGLGSLRQMAMKSAQLKRLEELEVTGYERDLNGTPVGRAPYAALAKAVQDGKVKSEVAKGWLQNIERFVKLQSKGTSTGAVFDSQPFEGVSDSGTQPSTVYQWGVELLKGGSSAHRDVHTAIERKNRELARIIGTDGMLVGGDGPGSFALSKDKTQNTLLQVNSTLTDIRGSMDKDYIDLLWYVNGYPQEYKPWFKTEEVQGKDAETIAKVMRDMKVAGVTLSPDDPIVNEVRDILGTQHAVKAAPPPVPTSVPPQTVAGAREGVING